MHITASGFCFNPALQRLPGNISAPGSKRDLAFQVFDFQVSASRLTGNLPGLRVLPLKISAPGSYRKVSVCSHTIRFRGDIAASCLYRKAFQTFFRYINLDSLSLSSPKSKYHKGPPFSPCDQNLLFPEAGYGRLGIGIVTVKIFLYYNGVLFRRIYPDIFASIFQCQTFHIGQRQLYHIPELRLSSPDKGCSPLHAPPARCIFYAHNTDPSH